jgi:hypothetical protein
MPLPYRPPLAAAVAPALTLVALAISDPPAPTACASAAWLAACTLRG